MTHAPAPKNEPQEIASLDAHYALPLPQVAGEIKPAPCIGPLVEPLTRVFQAIERSRVNKNQWKLLQSRCVMVLSIIGTQVMNNGRELYPELQKAAQLLEETLINIHDRAHHYNEMDEIIAFLLYPTINDEIQSLFGDLDSCLCRFSYPVDVAQKQWIGELQVVREQESKDLQRLKDELEMMNINTNAVGQSLDQVIIETGKIIDALRQVLKDKCLILREQPVTTSTCINAQQLIRTILLVTTLRLPPQLLHGRQCMLDANVPIRVGVNCDIYPATFLGQAKVAKKVFRIVISNKDDVEKCATRFLRLANLWNFQSHYILPFYGVGMEHFGQGQFQMYTVLPLIKNFDAVTYLKQYRNGIGMKKNILRIITDAAMGLQYLHSRNPPVFHSDMRGSKVLITDSGGAVLNAFGLSQAYGEAGTPATRMLKSPPPQRCLAPELLREDPILGTPCDVWGWAMAALEIISGSAPYCMHKQSRTVVLAIIAGPPKRGDYLKFNHYAYRPDEMWALLERCWAREPKNRPKMDEIVMELRDIAAMTEWGV
ncbi:unnamed protein product [Rhizoctonia solani]|uniref:Serine-threonine/tyrosine-protein kinase catalytic domain-containing protein n=1 Tax=Rhizoctonia solani TaxID=456999 RepID=A0A8H3DVN2_9AGAM|nr:unnamed protein product [Rhizoctonia solani]